MTDIHEVCGVRRLDGRTTDENEIIEVESSLDDTKSVENPNFVVERFKRIGNTNTYAHVESVVISQSGTRLDTLDEPTRTALNEVLAHSDVDTITSGFDLIAEKKIYL